jgi:hypothetical protein
VVPGEESEGRCVFQFKVRQQPGPRDRKRYKIQLSQIFCTVGFSGRPILAAATSTLHSTIGILTRNYCETKSERLHSMFNTPRSYKLICIQHDKSNIPVQVIHHSIHAARLGGNFPAHTVTSVATSSVFKYSCVSLTKSGIC